MVAHVSPGENPASGTWAPFHLWTTAGGRVAPGTVLSTRIALANPGTLPRILYMTTYPLAEARAQLSRLVDDASRTHERVEITRNGYRSAVLLGADDYDSLIETIDVLSDAELVADVRTALAEAGRGETHTLDEVRAAMAARGRLHR
jgi:prevent-host-death family protein